MALNNAALPVQALQNVMNFLAPHHRFPAAQRLLTALGHQPLPTLSLDLDVRETLRVTSSTKPSRLRAANYWYLIVKIAEGGRD